MSEPVLYKHGGIVSEENKHPHIGDVLVEEGIIVDVGSSIDCPQAESIDCSGKILLPALFDLHVHFREPGQEAKETIKTGSEAAINGGVTGVVMMPNTNPALDTPERVQSILKMGKEQSRIPIYTSGCITKQRLSQQLTEITALRESGVVMITDDGDPVHDADLLREAFCIARELDLMVASHCETKSISRDGAMHAGKFAQKLGVPGIPPQSEENCIERDLQLAQETGAWLHIQHVSTKRGMESIRRYKEAGVRVTCEVAPHHLLFTHRDVKDTHYKMNPPLRTQEDNEALLQGLLEGVFDIIATDHAPHTREEKNEEFAQAPFGITGLETALPSLYHYFIREEKFGWDLLTRRYAHEPRRLLNLPTTEIKKGKRAEFVVFNPQETTTFSESFMQSKSVNTPFLNQTLSGLVERVVFGDKVLLDRKNEK